jgi:cytochrome c-type biogenesis protein CcmH
VSCNALRTTFARVGLVAAFVVGVFSGVATATVLGPKQIEARERDIQQRVYSPCCYRETLDMHISPLSSELRIEIHERVTKGETPDAIIQDLVRRYGPQVLTSPPRRWTSFWLFVGPGLLSAGLLVLALRASRRGDIATKEDRPLAWKDPELEDRLTDELADLD